MLDGVAPAYIHRVGRRAACKHLRRVVQDLTWHGGVVLPSTVALVAGTGRRALLVLERSQRAPKGAAFSDGRFRRARRRTPCIRDASAPGTQGRPFGLNLEEYLTSGATKMHSGGAGTWILQWRKRLFHSPATWSHRRRRRRRQIGRMLLRVELTAPPTRQRRESIAKLFVCTAKRGHRRRHRRRGTQTARST